MYTAIAIVILGFLIRDGILRAVRSLPNRFHITHKCLPITIDESIDGKQYKVQ